MPGANPGGGLADLSAIANGPSPEPGGADGAQQGVEDFIGKIRELDQQVSSVLGQMPAAAQEAQQIKAALRRLIAKAAQMGPTKTASSDAVPMAGQ